MMPTKTHDELKEVTACAAAHAKIRALRTVADVKNLEGLPVNGLKAAILDYLQSVAAVTKAEAAVAEWSAMRARTQSFKFSVVRILNFGGGIIEEVTENLRAAVAENVRAAEAEKAAILKIVGLLQNRYSPVVKLDLRLVEFIGRVKQVGSTIQEVEAAAQEQEGTEMMELCLHTS